MIERTIAIRYARALLSLAKQENKIDLFGKELTSFCQMCQGLPDLQRVLDNRNHAVAKRMRIVIAIAQKEGWDPLVQNFLKLLIQKGRLSLINLIQSSFEDMAMRAQGKVPLEVVSAAELPEEQYKNLVRVFENKTQKTVVLRKKINPTVLGGVQVKLDDQLFDLTLRHQLNKLGQNLRAV